MPSLYSWENETPPKQAFSVRCSSEPVSKRKQKWAPDRKEYGVLNQQPEGTVPELHSFFSEMFKGDLNVQIEQYFTSQVKEMQITVTTRDLCCFSASHFPGSYYTAQLWSRLTMDNSLQYTRNIQFKSE
jgi:hypothetical protein